MKPFVTVYSEVSADGKTTHCAGASSKPMMEFEEEDIRKYRHRLRADIDAIMVGSTTVRTDNPHLTVQYVTGKNPLRVIVSSSGDLPINSNIFIDGERTLVAVSSGAPSENVAALEACGVDVVKMGGELVDLNALLDHLGSISITSLIVEGGATLLSSLFHSNLVDRLIVQHLPVIFGGANTPAMVGGEAISSVDHAILLRLVEVKQIGQHAVIIYERR